MKLCNPCFERFSFSKLKYFFWYWFQYFLAVGCIIWMASVFCKMAFFSSKCSPRMAKTSSRSSSIVHICNKMRVASWQHPKWTQCARCKYPSFYDLTAIKTLNLYKPSSDWRTHQLPWWSPGGHQVSPPVPRVVAPEVCSRKPEGSVAHVVKPQGLVLSLNCLLWNLTLRE